MPVLIDNMPTFESIGHWNGIACSADGNELVVVTGLTGSTTPIYISTDAGTTWHTSGAPTNLMASWRAAALSADGSKIVAAAGWWGQEKGPIYTSADSGITWVSNRAPVANWSSVASSADGGKLVAAIDGGGIYTFQFTPAPQLKIAPFRRRIHATNLAPTLLSRQVLFG